MMVQPKIRFGVYVVLDVLLLFIALCNIPSVFERARAPFDIETHLDQLAIKRITHPEFCPSLHENDRILRWNQYTVGSIDELEFLSDGASIGDKVTVDYERRGLQDQTEITLIPFYESPRFVIVMIIVGFVIWCTALFVAFNRLDGSAAYSLHWALVGLALTILLTQGRISPTNIFSLFRRVGLLVSYLFMAGLFLFFTTVYPRKKYGSELLKLGIIFLPVIVTVAITANKFLEAVHSPSAIDSYLQSYNYYHVVLTIVAIGMIVSVLDSYRHTGSMEERVRLQWILWGCVVGPLPFLLFIIIPQIVFSTDWIPEEFATVFLLVMPFSFAVSFAKYRLFDVQVVINRSIVYTILSIFIAVLYVLLVVLGTSLVGGEIVFTEYLAILIIALIIAWALNPLRHRLQRAIDETLFPARVNYRRTMTRLTDTLHNVLSVDELAQCIVQYATEAVQLKTVAFLTFQDGVFRMNYSPGELPSKRVDIPPDVHEQAASGRTIVLPGVIGNTDGKFDTGHSAWLNTVGFDLCIPLISGSGEIHGMICISTQRENMKLTFDELELLNTIAVQASEVLGRLMLQRKVILEQEERRKVEELNRMKSYFVSSVSHELQTPLTSIRMYTETLREGTVFSTKKRQEYLMVIDQESKRLSRLIDNVLDFSKVERGVKEYQKTDVHLVRVVKNAVASLRYQINQSGVKFKSSIAKSLPVIQADADALEEVIVNLLSNAIKYSGLRKEVLLRVYAAHKEIIVQVADKGIGLTQDELDKLFVPFHRGHDTMHIKGMGLGLALVKHIIDAHHGTITVRSAQGKGSTFTVCFPIVRGARRRKE